jgi:hypothetical protein
MLTSCIIRQSTLSTLADSEFSVCPCHPLIPLIDQLVFVSLERQINNSKKTMETNFALHCIGTLHTRFIIIIDRTSSPSIVSWLHCNNLDPKSSLLACLLVSALRCVALRCVALRCVALHLTNYVARSMLYSVVSTPSNVCLVCSLRPVSPFKSSCLCSCLYGSTHHCCSD